MAADLRESLRQRARTQVQQERTLSPTSAADGDSSMDAGGLQEEGRSGPHSQGIDIDRRWINWRRQDALGVSLPGRGERCTTAPQ